MSDYLWDGQGDPDTGVLELEGALRPFAWQPRPAPAVRTRSRRPLAIAVGVGLAAAIALVVWLGRGRTRPSWAMEVASGAARVDGHEVTGAARLAAGAWLETGTSRVLLRIDAGSTLELAPGTRARLVESTPQRQAIELARGRLAASVTSPPRHFFVETRDVVVTDLGCAFSVDVDEAGRGRVVVTGGQVAVAPRASHAEVVVPAGAECELDPRGPGVPFFSDASPAFRTALARISADPQALATLLNEARPKDRLTLAALADTAAPVMRIRVLGRMKELDAPAPPAPPSAPAPSAVPAPKATTAPSPKSIAHKTHAPKPATKPKAPVAAPAPTPKPKAPDSRPRLTHDPFKDIR